MVLSFEGGLLFKKTSVQRDQALSKHENMEKIRKCIEDSGLIFEEFADEVGIGYVNCQEIFIKNYNLRCFLQSLLHDS